MLVSLDRQSRANNFKMAPTPHQAKVNKAKIMAGGKKQPNARVARYLKSQESQMHEGPKNALLMKGIKCSGGMSVVLKDLVRF